MKRILHLILFALIPFAAYSQHGYQLDLNQLGTITFPDTPKSTLTGNSKVFTLADDSVIYVATTAPNSQALGVFGSALNDSFYNGVIRGSLKQAHGKLIYRNGIQLKNFTGVEFAFKGVVDSVNYYVYYQAYNIKNTLVLYGYWSRAPLQSGDKKMRTFFDSFRPSKNAFTISVNPVAGQLRRALWILFIVLGVLLAGVAALLIITKIRSAK